MTDLFAERRLDPDAIDIRENGADLLLIARSAETPIAHIVRCFPFSTPERWISLRDAEGEELGLLETLDGLNKNARRLLETRLRDRYHIPVIQRIVRVESGPTGAIWHIETEDDHAAFTLRGDRGFDLSAFPRIYLTDSATRKRYIIPDLTALDNASQKLARAHLPIGFRGGRGGPGGRRFR